jgi:hypothetical protein
MIRRRSTGDDRLRWLSQTGKKNRFYEKLATGRPEIR